MCVSYRIASKTTDVKSDEAQRGSLIREGEINFVLAVAESKYVQSVIWCDDYNRLTHVDEFPNEIRRIYCNEQT